VSRGGLDEAISLNRGEGLVYVLICEVRGVEGEGGGGGGRRE